jgi:hypothetical protein
MAQRQGHHGRAMDAGGAMNENSGLGVIQSGEGEVDAALK